MTIKEILTKKAPELREAKIPNPNLETEILLAFILKKPREFLFAYPEKIISQKDAARFALCVARRLKGEPIAYITGRKSFFGLDFIVNKNVLTPRPETEMMVEEALRKISLNLAKDSGGFTLIDIGTGSGCIIITIAKNQKLKIKNQKYFAIDISKKALTVARKNAKKNKVGRKIKFLQGNLLEPIINSKFLNPKSKIVILANLPYLTPRQVKNSPTIRFEPKLALVAGNDGLKYYRQLFKQIKILKAKSYKLKAMLEIDHTQTVKIKKLALSEFPKCNIKIKKDLSDYNRLVIIQPDLKAIN